MENACKNITNVARSAQLLKIDGFSLASKTMRENDCLKSRCNVDGYEWEIHCYPSSSTFGMWVALKLMFLSQARTCNVRASLGCLLVYPELESNASSTEKSVSHVFKRPKDCSREVLLVNKSSLPVPGCPKDDYLTVQCTIAVLKELPDIATTLPVPSSNLHRHFGDLLQSKMGADVTFLVSGESFAAHKLILAARSPVFMAEFFGDMKEKSTRRVEIKDMAVAAFKAMLHFIYTDTVPELDQQQEAATMMAQHLLAAADRYGLDRLKLICEGKLSGSITVDTAATTLALAEQHNYSQLKAKCVEFIISTPAILNAVMATEGYKHLEASCPLVLTDLLKSVHGRNN